ncbi:OX-2 membrane glycoprotein-like isoform X2 [Trachinotus anak]|uniref:OX-2 membrane glycoprotein-like isoform X2 n=1 Tax=Trachinotus anak TaxID=443729 RepID=UPI0039F182FC
MVNSAVYFLFMLVSLSKGVTAVIQTQQTVVAAVGEDALLSCQLTQPKDVLQVTWQKVFPQGEVNVATFSEPFGPKVINNFTDKVELKDAGLQSCSIVIRKVTEQDEGCYLCLFNSYPDGALTGRTCLQLYELHEPTLHVRESNSAEESLVSCSATGRPAPTVTLTVTQPHLYLSHYNVSVNSNNNNNNNDHTVTVNTIAVLSGFRDNSTQVGCAVRVLSVHKEVFVMIPGLKQTPADGFDEESGSIRIWIVLVTCAAVMIVMCLLQRNNSLSHGDQEMREMPHTTVGNTDM